MASPDKSFGLTTRFCAFISLRYNLTPREHEIMIGLIGEGLSNKELSEKLFISEKTMKNHMANIFQKLDIHSSRQILPLLLEEAVYYMRADTAGSNFWQRTRTVHLQEEREEENQASSRVSASR